MAVTNQAAKFSTSAYGLSASPSCSTRSANRAKPNTHRSKFSETRMTRDEWNKFSNSEKLDYLFNWNMRLEDAVKRLDVSIQLLEARLKISTERIAENVGSGS